MTETVALLTLVRLLRYFCHSCFPSLLRYFVTVIILSFIIIIIPFLSFTRARNELVR